MIIKKISKGPGGACVRRRGAPVPRHNGTMASPSLIDSHKYLYNYGRVLCTTQNTANGKATVIDPVIRITILIRNTTRITPSCPMLSIHVNYIKSNETVIRFCS